MRWIPVLILIYIWLISGLGDPGGPFGHINMVRWFPYILIPASIIIAFFVVVLKGRYKTTVIDGSILLIIFIFGLSAYINNKPSEHVIYATLVYLKYPVLFIVLNNLYANKNNYNAFIKLFFLITYFIIAEAIFNYIVFNKTHDWTYFTLGVTWGTRNAGIFFAYFVSFLFSMLFIYGLKVKYFLTFMFLVVALSIASIRSAIIFIPSIFFLIFLVKRNVIGVRSMIALSLFSFFIVFLSIYVGLDAYSGIGSIQYRLDYIHAVWDYLSDTGSLIVGQGPRSMKPGVTSDAGSVYQYFLNNSEYILKSGSNQYVKAFSEMGVVGFVLYWYMLVRVLVIAWKYWKIVKDDKNTNIFNNQAVLCLSFFGVWFFYSNIGLLFNDLWRMDASSIVFWVMASKIVVSYNKAKKTSMYIMCDQSSMKLRTASIS